MIRALWRLAGAVAEALRGALICALLFPFLEPPARMRHVGGWARRTLHRLGVTLEVTGAPRPGPLLLAANHVSWLDILVIDAVQPVRFVSKADVRHWPLLGWMVACGGTLFIERESRRDAMRVVHQMAQALQAGDHLAVFPEGTTGAGPQLLPFHANLLQAAVATHVPVQAVALRFADASARFSPAVSYVGDTSLLQSLWWVACADRLCAHVDFLEPQRTDATDRRALAQALRAQIAAALHEGAAA
jgi:1-acyl-sn-glycerol-3-phosphate acyltransferase